MLPVGEREDHTLSQTKEPAGSSFGSANSTRWRFRGAPQGTQICQGITLEAGAAPIAQQSGGQTRIL